MHIDLSSPIDADAFRTQANRMLAQQVPPADVDWAPLAGRDAGTTPFRGHEADARSPSALHSIVPRSFLRLTQLVLLHRDPSRFDLLYRLLWRLVHEPGLVAARDDPDVALARVMAQAVRRDLQKTRQCVHLRALEPHAGVALALAWCAPQHQVTEEVAAWLSRQHPQPPWLLVSPDRCVLWTGRHLLCDAGMDAQAAAAREDLQWHALAARLAAAPRTG
jgi:probable DNA metabolism protein